MPVYGSRFLRFMRYISRVAHPSFAPPPGFDELPTEAKVDYVSHLWERVFANDNPESPEWHRELVRAELEAQGASPSTAEPWDAAREEILNRLRRVGQ